MSLINDALQRARQVAQVKPALAMALPEFKLVNCRPERRSQKMFCFSLATAISIALGSIWVFHQNGVSGIRGIAVAPNPGGLASPPKESAALGFTSMALAPFPSQNVIAPASYPIPTTLNRQESAPIATRTESALQKSALRTASVPKPGGKSENQRRAKSVVGPSMPAPMAVESFEATISEPGNASLRVEAIHYRMDRPTAIINGRTLGVGDSIEGSKVVRITRWAVSLKSGNDLKDLAMN